MRRWQVIGSVAIVIVLAACTSGGNSKTSARYVRVSPHQPVSAAQAMFTVGAEQISNVSRIEAKLMSAGQALDALWPDSEKPPINRAKPVWVVAVRGTFRPPTPDNKQHTYPWAVFLVDASSFGFAGQPGYMSTTLADVRGTSGTWPPHFDTLPDASHPASSAASAKVP